MTVRGMLASLDSEELTRWMAYYRLNPWDVREDYRTAIVALTVYQMLRGKGSREMKAENFVPKFGEQRKLQSGEQMAAFLKAFTAAAGGEIRG